MPADPDPAATGFDGRASSLRKGVSLLVVQAVLGHSTLVSTERSLHLLRETMCAEVEQHAL